jgi:Ca-activated chloride channel family protein
MIHFEDPWILVLLAVIPLMVLSGWRRSGSAHIQFSSLHIFSGLSQPVSVSLRRVVPLLRCMVVTLIIIALARPQAGVTSIEIQSTGVDIMLCLDTSGSMRALDFSTGGKRDTRMAAVKSVVSEFVRGREHDRIGMVVFGEEAFTQCPLTLDYGVLLSLLDSLEIGMAGDATAIGTALGICVKRFKDIESVSRVVVLLTDGVNNSGAVTPLTAARLAQRFGIKVYTIGVGSEGKVPFQVDSLFGKKYVYLDADLDEETLRDIARMTGGQYFRATDTEALHEIYRQIDAMEKTEVEVKEYTEYNELFLWLLLPALFLLLLEIVLANTRFMKIP